MNNHILMTSGYNFEGYSISEYLGVYSGECALGTGFLSSLGASFADFLGSKSEMYSGKLKTAKDYAVEQLIEQVKLAGGNAIIGVDIDYTTFSADIMGVIANGTAVKIIKNANSLPPRTELSIKATNYGLHFVPVKFLVCFSQGISPVSLDIYCPTACNISGIMGDIIFTSIFDGIYTISNVEFVDFAEQSYKHFISAASLCEIPFNVFQTIKHVNFNIKKYIDNNAIFEPDTSISENAGSFNDGGNTEYFNIEEFINSADALSSAKEILAFLNEFEEDHPNVLNPALTSEIENLLSLERVYGNMKESAVNKIRDFYHTHNQL